MASRLFHALVVAGSSMAEGVTLGGCGSPPQQVPDGGLSDLAGWNMIDSGWPPIAPPDFATGDLRDAVWWPDIYAPVPDFVIQDLRWWPDIGVPYDLTHYDWIIIDMAPPRG